MCYKYQSQEADTHLLHQMVHHRTILRGGGHSRQTITRSKKATVIHQSTTHMGSSSGSEYRASESILNRANHHRQSWVQDGTPTQCPWEQSLDLPL